MASPSKAVIAAMKLSKATGLSALAAMVMPDGTGEGVFVNVGYAELAPEDAEIIAGTILRDTLRQSIETIDDCTCGGGAARIARLTAALEVLERDGAKLTGTQWEDLH